MKAGYRNYAQNWLVAEFLLSALILACTGQWALGAIAGVVAFGLIRRVDGIFTAIEQLAILAAVLAPIWGLAPIFFHETMLATSEHPMWVLLSFYALIVFVALISVLTARLARQAKLRSEYDFTGAFAD
jgi:hypothetical protein